jgi:hypothetical protein|eukprot:gnl/Ergobibamus_cyprinoides/4184.p1 GENE.gnl/Ergobibamus_cyprinoides/4184~~gnl/Ergobibamus_cyprinoides/4184.p1  ORF type:complete len:158 (-),score=37.86 gnl/Ergobibamus_cyprinoides/4184:190-663(-)
MSTVSAVSMHHLVIAALQELPSDVIEDVGATIACRMIERLTLGQTRLPTHLDAVKFICRDLWTAMFGRQVTELKTDRFSGYLVLDQDLPWLNNLSGAAAECQEANKYAARVLRLTGAMITAGLAQLGFSAVVTWQRPAMRAAPGKVVFTLNVRSTDD